MSDEEIVDESTTVELVSVSQSSVLEVDPESQEVVVTEEPVLLEVTPAPVVELVPPAGPGPVGPPGPPGIRPHTTVTLDDSPHDLPVESLLVLVDATGGDVSLNLPPASSPLVVYDIKKTAGEGEVRIQADGADLIDGDALQIMAFTGTSARLANDGDTGWWLT